MVAGKDNTHLDTSISLFQKEEKVICEASAYLQNVSACVEKSLQDQQEDASECFDYNEFSGKFSDLLSGYRKLYRQTVRLVKLSDGQQQELQKINKALTESQRQLEVRNEFIRNTFGRYLSDEIVNSLLDTPEGLALTGEKKDVTILMTDIRGFTGLCEKLSPEKVVRFLNIYLEDMTHVITKYNGTIDEIIGDAMLVIFGAPIVREHDAQRAVACALEMQAAMPGVNEKIVAIDVPPIAMGIGINSGPVIVGNIGSLQRSKYAVVGQNVNLAARIEAFTIGGQVLISGSTLQACGPILQIKSEEEVRPKGFENNIIIYDVEAILGDYQITGN